MTTPRRVPSMARRHCRHYSFVGNIMTGEPRCARGVEIASSSRSMLGFMACMPDPKERCDLREEWSEEEREAWRSYAQERLRAQGEILAALPRTGRGTGGEMDCPKCGGKISYAYASVNGHLSARCSTPACFAVIE